MREDIPVLLRTDVLVVGASFPGICAALAASRAGAQTVIVERSGVIGGQAAEIDTWGLDGFVDIDGKLLIDGIPWEILQKSVAQGQSDPLWTRIDMDTLENEGIEPALREIGLDAYVPFIRTGTFMNPFNDQYVDPNAYRYAAQKLLDEAGVTVLLEMPVTDTLLNHQRVYGVVAQGAFQKYAIEAKRVVDCSQNAVVCAYAGKKPPYTRAYMGTLTRVANVDVQRLIAYIRATDEPWMLRPMVGKRADPDEMLALADDGNPLAIEGFMTALDRAIQSEPEYLTLKQSNGRPLIFFYERDATGSYWTFGDAFADVDVSDPIAYSKAICAGRAQQWLMHRFFRDHIPGFENAHLMDVYPNISKAYHLSYDEKDFTEYAITKEEIQTGLTKRDDTIAVVRGHPSRGQNERGWPVPLAALIPKGLDGVLVTGKPACGMIHYLASCAKVGEAAGTAAAISARFNTPLRETDAARIREHMARKR